MLPSAPGLLRVATWLYRGGKLYLLLTGGYGATVFLAGVLRARAQREPSASTAHDLQSRGPSPRDRSPEGRGSDEPGLGAPHFLVLVPAHDEAAVVGTCVRSLLAQRYPRQRFQVVVIADHCSDDTAEVARAAGATVVELRGARPRGKASALARALALLPAAPAAPSAAAHGPPVGPPPELRGSPGAGAAAPCSRPPSAEAPSAAGAAPLHDAARGALQAVAVVDADNRADPDLLRALARRLVAGERCVQGLMDVSNADASWVSAASALGFWAIAGTSQAPREALGLSASLMGSGWAMPRSELERLLPKHESLTEDLELTVRLALQGQRVAWEPAARVFDEKPRSLGVALRQRQRWMRGRAQVVRAYLPELLRCALGQPDGAGSGAPAPHDVPHQRGGTEVRSARPSDDGAGGEPPGATASARSSRFATFDVAAQALSPTLLFGGSALLALGAGEAAAHWLPKLATAASRWSVATATGRFGLAATRSLGAGAGWPWTLAAGGALFLLPAFGLRRFSPPARVWWRYATQPAYLLLSVPLALQSALSSLLGVEPTGWYHTPHGR